MTTMDEEQTFALLSASKMRLRGRSPYLAVLAAYLEPCVDESVPTAATNGERLFINPKFWRELSSVHRDFVLTHEVLHAAQGHCWRVLGREKHIWNIAADFVVNHILKTDGDFELPPGALWGERWAEMTVEEVYALLMKSAKKITFTLPMSDVIPSNDDTHKSSKTPEQLDGYWKSANASAIITSKTMGNDPLMQKLSVKVVESYRDWREYLWATLPYAKNDFGAFDRRLIHNEIYVEDLAEDSSELNCMIVVDTSGSMIDILGRVIGEVEQIRSLYPQLSVKLYWADAAIIGPVDMTKSLRVPEGGGGTSFVPAFEVAAKEKADRLLYITDLEGTFPTKTPDVDTIWAVPAGTHGTPPFGKLLKVL